MSGAVEMVDERIRALPIVGEDRLVGIITETDLLRAFVRLTDQLAAPVAMA